MSVWASIDNDVDRSKLVTPDGINGPSIADRTVRRQRVRVFRETLFDVDTLLFGRLTYELLVRAWPSQSVTPPTDFAMPEGRRLAFTRSHWLRFAYKSASPLLPSSSALWSDFEPQLDLASGFCDGVDQKIVTEPRPDLVISATVGAFLRYVEFNYRVLDAETAALEEFTSPVALCLGEGDPFFPQI